MHNNYHFLKHLVPVVEKKITGKSLLECFSQNKDELVLIFADSNSEFVMRAALGGGLCALSFPKEFHRAKKNSVNLFKTVLDSKVEGVLVCENDRSFLIRFENGYEMIFLLYGRRANLFLVHESKIIESFRSQYVESEYLETPDRIIDQSLEAFKEVDGDLRKIFPTFGPLVKGWLKEKEYENSDIQAKWNLCQQALEVMAKPNFFVININDSLALSLIPLGEIVESFDDPIEAINQFVVTKLRDSGLSSIKKKLLSSCSKQISKTKNTIEATDRRLQQIENTTPYNQVADIIMANLHAIPTGATMVKLQNFYTGEEITIKLKKDLSPQKNAERYYRKAKNQSLEIDQLRQVLTDKQRELKDLESFEQKVSVSNNIKMLKEYEREVFATHSQDDKKEGLFKEFMVDGFKILVGRNSKNNDLLTQKHSHKDDLWLHAKDVSGSHVVIKHNSSRPFPKYVIEQAAAIAAYFSKRKTDSLCPVICTPKKFVRKPKGSLPGQVVVDKEDIVLVEPGLPA